MERGRGAVAEVRRPDRDGRALLDLAARRRSRPPRRSRRAASGASASWTASSIASGATRCIPEAKTIARSQRSPRQAVARGGARLERRLARVAGGREAGADPDGHRHRRYSAPCRGPRPSSRSSGRPGSARRRWRSRSPSGCAPAGEDPVAVSADALQLYRGLEILTGAPERGRAGAARAPARRHAAAHRDARAPASSPAPRTPRSTRCSPRAAGRSSSAAPACTCAPRWPSSTCARPSDPAIRARRRAQLEARRRAGPARRAGRARARDRRRDPPAGRRSASRARSSCSTPARRRPPGAEDSRLWTADAAPPDAAGRPHHGPRGARTPASRRASTRWSPPAPSEEVRARRRRRRVARRAPGARLRGAARRATSRR